MGYQGSEINTGMIVVWLVEATRRPIMMPYGGGYGMDLKPVEDGGFRLETPSDALEGWDLEVKICGWLGS